MSGARHFHIGDVLSAATGKLVSPRGIDGVYDILNWMTGERVYTHQLPRIGRESRPVILAAHPKLQMAFDEAEGVNRENWRKWLATWVARYGETIAVPKMTIAEHERIDPISELAEMVHPDKVISVIATPESSHE